MPSQFANTDAISIYSMPGCAQPRQLQTLVGASHLTGLTGTQIDAIEFRRSAKNQVFQGGQIHLDITLSISPRQTLQASSTFAQNVGPQPVQVFNGVVSVPTSPPEPGPMVAWTADNIVRIPFSTPFFYTGGTLLIDMVGTPQAGSEVDWWPADSFCEDLSGSTTDLGGGCGIYGGPSNRWSYVAKRTLVAGGYAKLSAHGTSNGLGACAFGQKATTGVPLAALGLNSPPGCELFLSTVDTIVPAIFTPNPLLSSGAGEALIELKLPGIASVLGASLTAQWIDLSQMASSNAIEWTIAPSIPTLDMATVEGHPLESHGRTSVIKAHVIRFEYQ